MTARGGDDQDDELVELTRRARAGDANAFERLARRVEGQIRAWARQVSADADDADDLTQLSLIRLHQRIGQFDGRSRLTTWLYRVVRSIAADHRRASTRRANKEERAAVELFAARAVDQAEQDDGARLAHLLAACNERLSAREREVFELADLRGIPPAVVAVRLGIAPSTARVLLLRARRKVRALMLEDSADTGGDGR
jgi:RNA polymerase sigma-70 factor (ECF subfamily)